MEHKTISELIDLSGKVAIVTGGAMGIGQAICKRLAEAGASVVVADLSLEKANATAKGISDTGGKVLACVVDVSDEAQVQAMIAQAVETFGRVDILVNNAGIYPFTPAMEGTKELFENILHTNLLGAHFCAQASAKQMIAQGRGGSIINITSIDALHPSSVGLAFYDASKHGLSGYTKSLALELAPHKIWVNAIAPGGVNTPGTGLGAPSNPAIEQTMDSFRKKIPMHRIAEADEIATVALFLVSEMSSYMTGSQIVVDGGTLLA
jgi:2-deoxy-D-gluconate 3-dehydrogenase